jgi:putative ABC transport system substrate-binding protein
MLAREPGGGGLIFPIDTFTQLNRQRIFEIAARDRLPAIYGLRKLAAAGGLMSYGIDLSGQFREAAGYASRILRGERPADLPVQAPTKFELVVNRKTAGTLGFDVPPALLARADAVIR